MCPRSVSVNIIHQMANAKCYLKQENVAYIIYSHRTHENYQTNLTTFSSITFLLFIFAANGALAETECTECIYDSINRYEQQSSWPSNLFRNYRFGLLNKKVEPSFSLSERNSRIQQHDIKQQFCQHLNIGRTVDECPALMNNIFQYIPISSNLPIIEEG